MAFVAALSQISRLMYIYIHTYIELEPPYLTRTVKVARQCDPVFLTFELQASAVHAAFVRTVGPEARGISGWLSFPVKFVFFCDLCCLVW